MSDTPNKIGKPQLSQEAKLRSRIDLAAERSSRAREIAAQHEALALTDSAPLRDLHHRMAAIHRRMERRHLVTVDLYVSVLATLQRPKTPDPSRLAAMPSLLSATAELAGSAGAVMALFDSSQAEALFLASDATARRVHDLEFNLGEGPSIDATKTRSTVTASGRQMCERWQIFGPEAAALDVHAIAATPLQAGPACLGTLTVLNPVREVSDPAIDLLGEALAYSLIDAFQAGAEGLIPVDGDHWTGIYKAVGMISARHGCSPADALALIRARAFTTGSDVHEVAGRIIRGDEKDLF
jgi:hypothetical protein